MHILVSHNLVSLDAEEQAVEVSYAADTDDVDCDFHIKESVISSSSAIQCNEKIEETQPFSFCMCVCSCYISYVLT